MGTPSMPAVLRLDDKGCRKCHPAPLLQATVDRHGLRMFGTAPQVEQLVLDISVEFVDRDLECELAI